MENLRQIPTYIEDSNAESVNESTIVVSSGHWHWWPAWRILTKSGLCCQTAIGWSMQWMSEYSRYDLSVVDEIFQRVTAREVVVEICGVTDDALWGAGRINVSCDNDGLNAGEHAEWTRGAGHLIHNLKMSKMKFNKVLYKNAIHLIHSIHLHILLFLHF